MKILYFITAIIVTITIVYAKDIYPDKNKTTSVDSNDSLNFCLALSDKKLNYCSKIQNKDKKSLCFGIFLRNSGYCSMIKDENIKNSCLSIALSDVAYCKKISDDKLRNSCIIFYMKYKLDKKDNCKEEK